MNFALWREETRLIAYWVCNLLINCIYYSLTQVKGPTLTQGIIHQLRDSCLNLQDEILTKKVHHIPFDSRLNTILVFRLRFIIVTHMQYVKILVSIKAEFDERLKAYHWALDSVIISWWIKIKLWLALQIWLKIWNFTTKPRLQLIAGIKFTSPIWLKILHHKLSRLIVKNTDL